MLVVLQLSQPQQRPARHGDQRKQHNYHAGHNPAPAQIGERHRQAELGLGHGDGQQKREEGAGEDER